MPFLESLAAIIRKHTSRTVRVTMAHLPICPSCSWRRVVLRSDKGNSLETRLFLAKFSRNGEKKAGIALGKTPWRREKPEGKNGESERERERKEKGLVEAASRDLLPSILLPAALDLIHSGWLHYSYYSASVRSFRSSVA